MCLGIPMQVIEKKGKFAMVRTGGLIRRVNIEMVSAVKKGDYVIVHAGFAIQILNQDTAKQTLSLLEE